ncbi:methyl-accepting chemotaxis protein [Spirochaeta cellobiosiphila]|uniref:methyl-accepting chemotaxis protein n=1 Tax=Spirochaeta cellobiosiphila TaxID=504483 RepID=UPI00048C97E6|nr:methyl-accepting chemotaxis protein [Spirochaeta cellobiosiphila]
MKNKRKHHNLTKRFVLIIGLLFILMFVIQNFLSIKSVQQSTTKDYQSFSNAILQANATNLTTNNSKYTQQVRIYTKDSIMDTHDPEQIIAWLKTQEGIRSGDFTYAMYIDPDGVAHSDTGATENVANQAFFKEMFINGANQYIGDPIMSSISNSMIIPITKGMFKGNGDGFMAVALPLESIQKKVDGISVGAKGYAFLLAGDGTVLSHPDKSFVLKKNFVTMSDKEYKGLSKVAKDMIAGNSNTEWINDGSRGRSFITYIPINKTPWSLALVIPENQVYKTASNLQINIIFISVIIVLILLIVSGFLIQSSLKPLKNVEKTIHGIATGNADLTQRIEVKSRNEIGSVTSGFNSFVEKLQTIMQEVKSSKDQLSEAGSELDISTKETSSSITDIIQSINSISKQIASQATGVDSTAGAVRKIAENITTLEKMIENQSAGVTEASAAVEEMIGNITGVNGSVEKMALSFEELEEKAKSGIEKQESVNERIGQIENQSQMLQEANTAIANIASQTNLLAMNAAIEAAHAGDAGKGFSVVADEIRKLSETSTIQSKTIGEQLNKIRDSIGTVVDASAESSETFNAVAESIRLTDQLVRQIKNAMEEQQQGSKQISISLSSMNDSTSEVYSASADMSKNNSEILEEIKRLQQATDIMQETMTSMSSGASQISQTESSLIEIVSKMKEAIDRIGNQIDQFHV